MDQPLFLSNCPPLRSPAAGFVIYCVHLVAPEWARQLSQQGMPGRPPKVTWNLPEKDSIIAMIPRLCKNNPFFFCACPIASIAKIRIILHSRFIPFLGPWRVTNTSLADEYLD